MPLSENRDMLKLSDELVNTMRDAFKTPLNYRPGRIFLQ